MLTSDGGKKWSFPYVKKAQVVATLRKTNIAPEKWWLGDYFPFCFGEGNKISGLLERGLGSPKSARDCFFW